MPPSFAILLCLNFGFKIALNVMLMSSLKSILNICINQGKIQYPKASLALSINIKKIRVGSALNEYQNLLYS